MPRKDNLSYKKLKREVLRLKIASSVEYRNQKRYKEIPGASIDPQRIYKEWKNWIDFLDTKCHFCRKKAAQRSNGPALCEKHSAILSHHSPEYNAIVRHILFIIDSKNRAHRLYKRYPIADEWNPRKGGLASAAIIWIVERLGRCPKGKMFCMVPLHQGGLGLVPRKMKNGKYPFFWGTRKDNGNPKNIHHPVFDDIKSFIKAGNNLWPGRIELR
jgi:hypothetical protein